jgi:L-amino acid N-acyltransferase YncA
VSKRQTEELPQLFTQRVEWTVLPQVLGSGYEERLAKLAIRDGIAKRAARKNMQIHSAVILEAAGSFVGFMTFQNNREVGEFCLLQSVIEPSVFSKALYRELVERVLAENHDGYPAIITTDPKSKFETPKLFEDLGFRTYLKMSGFHYMVLGDLCDVRMKLLAHITMTNVWNTVKGDWLRLKREWNERINAAGDDNALYATRGGCWQGVNGFSNVVNTKRVIGEHGQIVTTTKAHNSNASVLDPVACEVIARFCMPTSGGKIYNPFGGGVQMGYVAGASGYGYLATEIRRNQTDANNLICSEFPEVQWVHADSSEYEPENGFDMVFTCPPYYKVEKYLDYGGEPPYGELNTLPSYEEFRDTLFRGYVKAIGCLKDQRFFVVMVGDSRGKDGGYYGAEAETELFLRDHGLRVYNRIVYLEAEFTRLAHAKRTLNTRKFPKREQKIIMAFKGDTSKIKDEFMNLGRL